MRPEAIRKSEKLSSYKVIRLCVQWAEELNSAGCRRSQAVKGRYGPSMDRALKVGTR